MIGTVEKDDFRLMGEEPLRDGEGFADLPDLVERQETLKLANEALRRARTLLAHLNQSDPETQKNIPELEPPSNSAAERGS
jgi:hypothetical protein